MMNRKERRRQEKAAKAAGGFQPGPAKPSQVSNALFACATGQSGSPVDLTQSASPLLMDYDPIQDGLQKAAEFLSRGDHAGLNAHCRQLLDAHPDHPDVHYVTGLTAFVMNDLRRAEEHLQQAIDGGTEYAEAALYLGDILVQEKRYAEGEELIRSALAREPANDEFKMRLVLALQNQNKMSEAIEIYESLSPAMMNNADIQHNMGHAYFQADRIDEAGRCYKRCVEMHPSHQMGLIGLGTSSLAAVRNDEARTAYQQCLQFDPNNVSAKRLLEELDR